MTGAQTMTWPAPGPLPLPEPCDDCFPGGNGFWQVHLQEVRRLTVAIRHDDQLVVHERVGFTTLCGLSFDDLSLRNFRVEQ